MGSKLQPPGGDATICLGVDDEHVVIDVPPSGRKAPGGDDSVCLGTEEPAELDCLSSGFGGKQVPGGTSTICFGASEIQRPSSGFGGKQEPGGKSSFCLGVEDDETHESEERPWRAAVGGESTLCLGVLEEDLIAKQEQPTGRVEPGGATTICLGIAELSPRGHSHRQAPGGNSTICLGECVGDENINTLNSIMHAQDVDGKKTKFLAIKPSQMQAQLLVEFGFAEVLSRLAHE